MKKALSIATAFAMLLGVTAIPSMAQDQDDVSDAVREAQQESRDAASDLAEDVDEAQREARESAQEASEEIGESQREAREEFRENAEERWEDRGDRIEDRSDDDRFEDRDRGRVEQWNQQGQGFDSDRRAIGVMLYPYNDRVVVRDVQQGGPAFQAGLRPNDEIVRFDGRDISSTQMFVDGVGQFRGDGPLMIEYRRNGQLYSTEVQPAQYGQVFREDLNQQDRSVLRPNFEGGNDMQSLRQEIQMLRQEVNQLQRDVNRLQASGGGDAQGRFDAPDRDQLDRRDAQDRFNNRDRNLPAAPGAPGIDNRDLNRNQGLDADAETDIDADLNRNRNQNRTGDRQNRSGADIGADAELDADIDADVNTP